MEKIKVAINGFGRIGRVVLRCLLEDERLEVVGINDLMDNPTMAHLFKYDSVHRLFAGEVRALPTGLMINDTWIKTFSESEPTNLPWKDLGVDVVLEATGKFRSSAGANGHLAAGAKKVIITAPPEGDDIQTVAMGINDETVTGEETVISNASCTTNSVAPLISILRELSPIQSAYITTVHSFTTDQRLHDAPHRDLRRARAAGSSIVPTTTGAAKAITRIFPELEGNIGGCGIRVPVPNGSLTDLTVIVADDLTETQVNAAFRKAAEGPMRNILEYQADPIVSVDILGNKHSCVFDAQLTSVIGKMVKVVGWYDNEMGYSHRLVDLIHRLYRSA